MLKPVSSPISAQIPPNVNLSNNVSVQ
ncbi:unnamed protein product, partial [Rotaria sp. Silwood1]